MVRSSHHRLVAIDRDRASSRVVLTNRLIFMSWLYSIYLTFKVFACLLLQLLLMLVLFIKKFCMPFCFLSSMADANRLWLIFSTFVVFFYNNSFLFSSINIYHQKGTKRNREIRLFSRHIGGFICYLLRCKIFSLDFQLMFLYRPKKKHSMFMPLENGAHQWVNLFASVMFVLKENSQFVHRQLSN